MTEVVTAGEMTEVVTAGGMTEVVTAGGMTEVVTAGGLTEVVMAGGMTEVVAGGMTEVVTPTCCPRNRCAPVDNGGTTLLSPAPQPCPLNPSCPSTLPSPMPAGEGEVTDITLPPCHRVLLPGQLHGMMVQRSYRLGAFSLAWLDAVLAPADEQVRAGRAEQAG